MQPKYQCCKCNFWFVLDSLPLGGTSCFRCGSILVKWVNYDELFNKSKEIRKESSR